MSVEPMLQEHKKHFLYTNVWNLNNALIGCFSVWHKQELSGKKELLLGQLPSDCPCRQICWGHYRAGGPCLSWVLTTLGSWVLCWIRKQVEQTVSAHVSKQHSSITSVLLSQLQVPTLSSFPSWWTVTSMYKINKTFPPQVAFGYGPHQSSREQTRQ